MTDATEGSIASTATLRGSRRDSQRQDSRGSRQGSQQGSRPGSRQSSPARGSAGSGASTATEQSPLLARFSARADAPETRVNPLNRRNARVYRAVLVGMFVLSLFWLALLSIDQLISVGVSATFGSGFETYTVSAIGLASIGLSLLFYRAPSPSDRALNLVCAALLIVDMLVISIVDQLRHRYGAAAMLIGFGGTVGACLLGSISDTVVQQARDEEQERVFGHSSNRRSVLEWLGVTLSNVARAAILVAIVLLSVNLVFDAADSQLQIGSLVPVGGTPDSANDATLIHLACTPAADSGRVVVIESGETSGEEMLTWVQRARGVKTVCYWDRPGLGLSDNAPSPIAMDAVMSYLVAALEHELPDFRYERILLVSHGVGSLYSRVFANKISDQLAGLMLVDPLHEELFYQQQSVLYGLKEFVKGVLTPLTLGKFEGLLTGLGAEERLFGLLEHTQPRLHKALLQQQVSARRRSAVDIGLATASLPRDVPLLVVSSADMCQSKEWNRYQRLLLKLSDNTMAWKILDGPHNLWWNKRSERDLTDLLESFVKHAT